MNLIVSKLIVAWLLVCTVAASSPENGKPKAIGGGKKKKRPANYDNLRHRAPIKSSATTNVYHGDTTKVIKEGRDSLSSATISAPTTGVVLDKKHEMKPVKGASASAGRLELMLLDTKEPIRNNGGTMIGEHNIAAHHPHDPTRQNSKKQEDAATAGQDKPTTISTTKESSQASSTGNGDNSSDRPPLVVVVQPQNNKVSKNKRVRRRHLRGQN